MLALVLHDTLNGRNYIIFIHVGHGDSIMKHTVNAKLLFLFMLIPITGCMEQDKRQQLEKVAKDWCTTIRASQVIPVYPLTEDIQPGDVFLVRTPIQKQAEEYTKKGFLPLDQRMTRFFGIDYRSFYQNSFGTADHYNTPHHWQFPPGGLPVSLTAQKNKKDRPEGEEPAVTGEEKPAVPDKEGATVSTHEWLTDWPNAPRVMFPSYSFNVQSGQGVTAALPIKGIPVGLSLMNADRAKATVSIKDAYTYGVPLDWIHAQIKNWAQKPLNKEMLDSYRKAAVKSEKPLDRLFRILNGNAEPTVYLRVINRVYLTGSLDVSMDTAKSWGFGGKAGEAPNAKIPTLDNASSLEESVVEGYKSTLNALNETLDVNNGSGVLGKAMAGKGYGGRLKVVWAGGRSVTLSETFDRPLVIGYLGFDFPIMPDGRLGLPVATRDILTTAGSAEPRFAGDLTEHQISIIPYILGSIYENLEELKNSEQEAAKYWQALNNVSYNLLTYERIHLDTKYKYDPSRKILKIVKSIKINEPPTFADVTAQLTAWNNSQEALALTIDLLEDPEFRVMKEGNLEKVNEEMKEQLRIEYRRQHEIWSNFIEEVRSDKSVVAAIRYYRTFFNVEE